MKVSIKNVFAKISAKTALVGTVIMSRVYAVNCDIWDLVDSTSGNIVEKLVGVGKALFPIAAVACAIAMFFTRDQKKFETEKHLLIACCGAFILLLIIDQGDIVATLTTLVGG